MKKKHLLTITLFLFFTIITSAQAPPPPPPPPPGLPIDGGIVFLIIAGVAYGIKKVRD